MSTCQAITEFETKKNVILSHLKNIIFLLLCNPSPYDKKIKVLKVLSYLTSDTFGI